MKHTARPDFINGHTGDMHKLLICTTFSRIFQKFLVTVKNKFSKMISFICIIHYLFSLALFEFQNLITSVVKYVSVKDFQLPKNVKIGSSVNKFIFIF